MNKLCLKVGVIFIAVFISTGRYMKLHFPALYGDDEGVRMMYRSRHIYILFGALLNLLAFAAFEPRESKIAKTAQNMTMAIIALAPALMCYSFFFETAEYVLGRGAAFLGVLFSLIGVISFSVINFIDKEKSVI